MPSTERILVENIVQGERHRALNDDAVDVLVGSIERLGLRTPITVRVVDEMEIDGEPCDNVPVLVTGAHRLAAAKRLGWDYIDCFVTESDDPIRAEMWEIAENLHRAELTALERDEQVARWIELATKKYSQTENNSRRGPKTRVGVSVAERELGIDKTAASRAAKTSKLSPEAKQAARETGLDNNRTALLDAASRTDADEQVAVLRARAQKRPAPPLSEPLNDIEAANKAKARLIAAWNVSPPEIRDWFRDWIDTPVMDNARTGS